MAVAEGVNRNANAFVVGTYQQTNIQSQGDFSRETTRVDARWARIGKIYHTPLDAHPVEGGYLFILVYGSKSDWVQNVMAAKHARLTIDGKEVELVRPRIVGQEHLPAGVAPPPSFFRISEYLRMDTAEG